eukprot:gene9333-10134_t
MIAVIRYFALHCLIFLFQRFIVRGENRDGADIFSIPAILEPRFSLRPIKNYYGVKNSCDRNDCGDFHVIAYFQGLNTAQVIVRRLDELHWKFNISIFVTSVFSPSHSSSSQFKSFEGRSYVEDVIVLGPSKHFELITTINTSVILTADDTTDQNQTIPKIIFQTFSSRAPNSIYQWMARKTFEELNPEYRLFMFNDRECRDFIRRHFSDYTLPPSNSVSPLSLLEAYDRLISPTFKADIFRYAYLALHGGCYFDHKMIARKPLRHIIRPNDSFLVCSDALSEFGAAPLNLKQTQRLYNAVICSQAQDRRLWRTIDFVLRNIEVGHQTGSDLSLTGPSAFFQAVRREISEDNVRFAHGYQRLSLSKRRKYEDFFVQEKIYHEIFLTKFYKGFHADPQARYGRLWQLGLVYYDPLVLHPPWKLYVYPRQSRCVQAIMSSIGSNTMAAILKPQTILTQQELLYQEEGDALCRLIHLQVVQGETSEVWSMDITASDVINGKGHYRIPFDFSANAAFLS